MIFKAINLGTYIAPIMGDHKKITKDPQIVFGDNYLVLISNSERKHKHTSFKKCGNHSEFKQ